MDTPIIELLSQSEVSRLANISPPRFARLVRKGQIVPDFKNGKTLLFQLATAQTIKANFGK